MWRVVYYKPAGAKFKKATKQLGMGCEAGTLDTTHIEVSGDLAYGLGISTMLLKPLGEAPREEKGSIRRRLLPASGRRLENGGRFVPP